jgi:hypothetical protein
MQIIQQEGEEGGGVHIGQRKRRQTVVGIWQNKKWGQSILVEEEQIFDYLIGRPGIGKIKRKEAYGQWPMGN